MFLLLSVFVLASVAIPEVAAGHCEDLNACVTRNSHGNNNGTWYWLFMTGPPANQTLWSNYTNRMCNNWRGRSSCNTAQTRHECRNATIRRKARYERKKTKMLCLSTGRQFLGRIYTEAPQCIGNSSLTWEAMAQRASCLAGQDLTVHSHNRHGGCDASTAARNCYRAWIGERCGDLFRWLVDQEWAVRNEVYFPTCNPSQFAWPSG